MAYYRDDPSGGRPPTPYPFPRDPTWGTFEKPRRRRHSFPTERPRDYVYVLKGGSRRSPERVCRRASHADRGRIYDGRPAYRRRGDTQWTERRSSHPSYRDDGIQRKIDAHNEEIAARPSRPGGVRGRKTVRFELPGHHRAPKESLMERLERLSLEEPPKRCRLCGRRLKGVYRC